MGAPPGLWLVGPDSPIREVQQAIDAKMKWRWASAGGTSGLGIGAAFTCEALKLDCHIVQGYKGSADAGLAVTRGEMDAVYVPESSANHFVKSKQNWALATISRTKSQFFQDRPTVFEAAKIDADRMWAMDFLANLEGTGRLLMAPPGIPPARLAYLQAAVKETLLNPQLIAESVRMERIVEYLDPASTHKNVVSVVERNHARTEGARAETAVGREINASQTENCCRFERFGFALEIRWSAAPDPFVLNFRNRLFVQFPINAPNDVRTYKPFIDGLRAIAIITVVGSHLDLPWLSGGYVGVDIFFVISGYLIINQIVADIENKRFSLFEFGARRAFRILPAFLLVMMTCLVLVTTVLVQPEYKDFAQFFFFRAHGGEL